MPAERGRFQLWKLALGLVLVAWGGLHLAESLELAWAAVARDWMGPVALVVVGLCLLIQRDGRSLAGWWPLGLLLMLGGLLGGLARLGWDTRLDLGDLLLPGLLILLGFVLIRRVLVGARGQGQSSENDLHMVAILGGSEAHRAPQALRGGSLTAVMGACELDLTEAELDPEGAVLEVFAMWGAVEITVPPHWRVTSEVLPLMGAFEDKRKQSATDASQRRPELTIRGMALMGGVGVLT